MKLSEVLNFIFQPISILSFAILIILIIALIKMRKVKLTTRTIAVIGVVLALSTVLSLIKFANLPFGGSTTLGSMVPIIILALIAGPEVGFLAGLLFGIINLIVDPYIVHPAQLILDYPLAYMCLGFAGFFKNAKMLAPFAAIGGRFIFHYLSGIIFFASDAPSGQSVFIYSLIYNCSYLIPELIITLVIIAILPIASLRKALNSTR